MITVLNCGLKVSMFKPKSCYHVRGINLLILPDMFYKDGFGIKLPIKVDMPLNKETRCQLFSAISVSRCKMRDHFSIKTEL